MVVAKRVKKILWAEEMRDNCRGGTGSRMGGGSKCGRNQPGRMPQWKVLRHHASGADDLRGNVTREQDPWGRETRDEDEVVKVDGIPRRGELSNT